LYDIYKSKLILKAIVLSFGTLALLVLIGATAFMGFSKENAN